MMRELSLNIMDLAQNSIAAGGTLIEIRIAKYSLLRKLVIVITDNGCGMESDELCRAQSAFYTTRSTRSVGLGIPFFKMAAEMTGGNFYINSQPGTGTRVSAIFHTGHIDMLPLGDVAETVLLLIICNPNLDFVYRRSLDERSICLDTREMRDALGENFPLSSPDVVVWLREYIREQEESLSE